MKKGMTYEQVMEQVREYGWQVLDEQDKEEDGYQWKEIDIQMDSEYGLSLYLVDGKVEDMDKFAMWDYADYVG